MVDVKLKKKFPRVVSLRELKSYADRELHDFRLLAKGNRLSVMPVTAAQWRFIESLSQGK